MVILFLIRFNGTVLRFLNDRRSDAEREFAPLKKDARYTLHALIPATRQSEGGERWLIEKDRAKGRSAVLKGMRSRKWLGGRVVVGLVETRIA